MPELVLKCPTCGKTTEYVRCAGCGARAKHLFLDRYADGSARGIGCRKCRVTLDYGTCPGCGAEYDPALLAPKRGSPGCVAVALVVVAGVTAVACLLGTL